MKKDSSQKKKTSKSTIWLRVIAVILLVVGVALIFSPKIRDFMVHQNQTTVLKSINRKSVETNEKKKGMFDYSKVKDIDFSKVTKSRVKNTSNAIGAIAIPAVKMYLPILKGLSDDSLSTGGGTMRADQVMGKGNYPLAGHYMTAKGVLFSPLDCRSLRQSHGELLYAQLLYRHRS